MALLIVLVVAHSTDAAGIKRSVHVDWTDDDFPTPPPFRFDEELPRQRAKRPPSLLDDY